MIGSLFYGAILIDLFHTHNNEISDPGETCLQSSYSSCIQLSTSAFSQNEYLSSNYFSIKTPDAPSCTFKQQQQPSGKKVRKALLNKSQLFRVTFRDE